MTAMTASLLSAEAALGTGLWQQCPEQQRLFLSATNATRRPRTGIEANGPLSHRGAARTPGSGALLGGGEACFEGGHQVDHRRLGGRHLGPGDDLPLRLGVDEGQDLLAVVVLVFGRFER